METLLFKNNIEVVTLRKLGIADFAKARNALLEKAKAEWVFFLDSDEKISSKLKRELSELFSTSQGAKQPQFSGFIVPRKNYFLGRFIGTDKILRLGRKSAGRWERKVHEVWKIKGGVGELKNPLIHNTAGNLRGFIEKINYYSTLHAEANRNEGKRSDLFKIIFYPKVKFIQSLIMGRGTVFSILQAFHSFLAWSKLWILQKD